MIDYRLRLRVVSAWILLRTSGVCDARADVSSSTPSTIGIWLRGLLTGPTGPSGPAAPTAPGAGWLSASHASSISSAMPSIGDGVAGRSGGRPPGAGRNDGRRWYGDDGKLALLLFALTFSALCCTRQLFQQFNYQYLFELFHWHPLNYSRDSIWKLNYFVEYKKIIKIIKFECKILV